MLSIALFAGAGVILLFNSYAATPTANIEAENGTIAGTARIVSNATASGGQAVLFEAGTAGTPVKPDATNTGVPPGHTLTIPVTDTAKGITVASNGNATITKPGVFENMLIKGRLSIAADNVTIRYSRIEANPTPWDLTREGTSLEDCRAIGSPKEGDIVKFSSQNKNLVIEDSELVAVRKSVNLGHGLHASNYTLRRVEISGAVDGLGIYNTTGPTNVLVEDSYIHDIYYYPYQYGQKAADQGPCGATHSDAIQVHFGSGAIIRNNTLLGRSYDGVVVNAAIQVNENGYPTSDLWITGNWMDYGGCSLNVARNSTSGIVGLRVTNNKFGKNQRLAGCAMIIDSVTKSLSTTQVTGNVWEDGSLPAPTVKNGG